MMTIYLLFNFSCLLYVFPIIVQVIPMHEYTKKHIIKDLYIYIYAKFHLHTHTQKYAQLDPTQMHIYIFAN